MDLYSELLTYSKDIYKSENQAQNFYSDPKTDLQVGIYITDKICISFRGTESKKDMSYDVYRIKKNMGGGKYVHGGFYDQLFSSDVYQSFNKFVTRLIYETDLDIYVTGHSLGGALATLYGYELSKKTTKQINVVSFASPKVGNWAFFKDFKKIKNLSHVRIANSRDPVTLFPLFNYYHTGKIITLKSTSYFYSVNNHYVKMYEKYINKKNKIINDKYVNIYKDKTIGL